MLTLGIPAERIVKQGLGVDPAECTGGDRGRARSEWQCSETDCVVGHLANLSPPKGTVDLLRAARQAWQQGARFGVVLAGPQMPEFRRFWQRNFVPKKRVTLLGTLDDKQKHATSLPASTFAACRRAPSRSGWYCWVLGERKAEHRLQGRGHRRTHSAGRRWLTRAVWRYRGPGRSNDSDGG